LTKREYILSDVRLNRHPRQLETTIGLLQYITDGCFELITVFMSSLMQHWMERLLLLLFPVMMAMLPQRDAVLQYDKG